MGVHTTVTTISHGVQGSGQVWYRVTGRTQVGAQVAYRVADHRPDVRRVRFAGAGATARLLEFRPGDLVRSERDMQVIARAFAGVHLTHGVKTQRSSLSRVVAAPVRDAIVDALARAGLAPGEVFTTRESAKWWAALDRAGDRGRTVALRSALGSLRLAGRAGAPVEPEAIWSRMGAAYRDAMTVVDVGRRVEGFTYLTLDLTLADDRLGELVSWRALELGAASEPVGNAGYELTLTIPKSFSLAAIAGDPARMDDWFTLVEDAAQHAMARLMDEAGFCSTGHRGDGEDVTLMPANGWAGTISTEISSRAGDPHLHAHCLLPNELVGYDQVVRTMGDGGREIHVNAARFAAWGQAYLVREALARGLVHSVRFDPVGFQWTAEGFTERTVAEFSRGRNGVLTAIADLDDGTEVTPALRIARDRIAKRNATATKGDEQPTWSQLRAATLQRAQELGIDLESERTTSIADGRSDPATWTDDTWVEAVEGELCRHKAGATLAQVNALIDMATALMDDAASHRVRMVATVGGFTRAHGTRDIGMKSGGRALVSKRVLAAEGTVVEVFTAGQGVADRLVTSERLEQSLTLFQLTRGITLTGEQVDAITAVALSTDTITLVSGVGGSGKTTVLAALTKVLHPVHTRLLVVAVSNSATAIAARESGAPTMNLTALRARIAETDPGRRAFDVVVVDEASMADAAAIADLAAHCRDTGARMVLQGDHRQLKAVGAGDIYNALCEEHPDRVIRLTGNQRQLTPQGRHAAEALHERDLPRAWRVLDDTDRILVVRGRQAKTDAIAALVVDRISEHGAAGVTCDAVTNAEADQINAAIHARLVDQGQIHQDTVRTYRHRGDVLAIGTGTLLRVAEPAGPRSRAGHLTRGTRATVTDAQPDRITVALDNGHQRTLTPAALIRHFAYGYAGTVHKVQGQTSIEHVSSLSRGKDQASLYVSATRPRQGVTFVADACEWLNARELLQTAHWPTGYLHDTVIDRMESVFAHKPDDADTARGALRPRPSAQLPEHRPATYTLPAPTGPYLGLS
jgi:hypothetical protein